MPIETRFIIEKEENAYLIIETHFQELPSLVSNVLKLICLNAMCMINKVLFAPHSMTKHNSARKCIRPLKFYFRQYPSIDGNLFLLLCAASPVYYL